MLAGIYHIFTMKNLNQEIWKEKWYEHVFTMKSISIWEMI